MSLHQCFMEALIPHLYNSVCVISYTIATNEDDTIVIHYWNYLEPCTQKITFFIDNVIINYCPEFTKAVQFILVNIHVAIVPTYAWSFKKYTQKQPLVTHEFVKSTLFITTAVVFRSAMGQSVGSVCSVYVELVTTTQCGLSMANKYRCPISINFHNCIKSMSHSMLGC